MRRGFNRLEWTIVLVILGVLIGLLLPAVQRMREAAARQRCQNNLRQHGLAAHSYLDAKRHFPPGTMPNAALPPEERLSFHVALVPYIEACPLYKAMATDEAWDSPANVRALTELGGAKHYFCPSWGFGPGPASLPVFGHRAVTNYVGVAGVGADAAMRPADAPGLGMFGYDRTTKKEDVKDGLENTAMLLETARDLGPWVRGGPGTVRAVEADDLRFGGTHEWHLQLRKP